MRRKAFVLTLIAWRLFTLDVDGSSAAQVEAGAQSRANAGAGRSVFNGKGVCYYCHGVDGDRTKMPQLAPDTAALIAQLNPQPPDLRTPKLLRLKNDAERAKAIREGHPGTGMFPDTTMTEEELAGTLAYLAVLRREGHRTRP